MKITLDFETRSRVDLKAQGVYNYARHESTEILCAAVKVDDGPTRYWVPAKFRHIVPTQISEASFITIMLEGKIFEAHNAQFERLLWLETMVKRHGYPAIMLNQWRCTAALAAAYSLPRSLGEACKALNLPEQKDLAGYWIMMRMCKPRKPTIADPVSEWNEHPDDFRKLCEYCAQDVEAEYALSNKLHDLPKSEWDLYHLDQKINDRGILIDRKAVANLKKKVKSKEKKLLIEMQSLTNNHVKTAKQLDKLLEWLDQNGCPMEDLSKNEVELTLEDPNLSPRVRRALEIRKSLALSSVSKLEAMENLMCEDDRVRGTLLFHGANTGRWSATKLQTQNFPRSKFETEDVEFILKSAYPEIEMLHDDVIFAVSKSLRGMIIAPPDQVLACSDYSSVEARAVAWLAGELHVLKAFQEGKDLYKVAADNIYGCGYDNVTKDQRMIGKVATLALGYQGWLGAFHSMAKGYSLKLEDDEAEKIIINWREAHPNIRKLWRGLEWAAMETVKTGASNSYGPIRFGIRNNFLHMRLPSGRLLAYYDPQIRKVDTKYETGKEVVTFMGVNSFTRKWCRMATYGGKLTENATQATARDLLKHSLFNFDRRNYNIVGHVHDEIQSEVDEAGFNLKEYDRIMAETPEWAVGLPLEAEGFTSKRYRKG